MDKKVKILTLKSSDYKRHHVTGFWGGITSDGQKLNIELFEDAPPMADELTMHVDDKGKVLSQEVKPLDYEIVRHVCAGITIPMSEIPSIIEWLKHKYEEYSVQQNNDSKTIN